MKKTIIFLILFILIVPVVYSVDYYECVSTGLFSSVFSGANLTSALYAPDFLLSNGTSCCGEAGGGGVTYTGGANISLAGNVISINKSFAGWDTNASDDLSLETLDNVTVVRSYNTSWVDGLIDARVVEAFLTTILDTVYATITYVDARVNSIVNTTDSVIQGWIDSNSTVNRAYTDTRVDSVENFTMQDINNSFGNWSQAQSSYYTTTQVDSSFSALPNLTYSDVVSGVGNWTNDKPSYPLASSLPNVTIQEINDSQGNWSQDKSNYYTTTQIDTSFNALHNVSMQEINNSFGNWSQYLDTYPDIDTDDTDDATIQQVNDSLGNHSQWLATYPNVDTDSTDDMLNTGDTATGNYTFDTNTFFIDSTNNRVGIGQTGGFDPRTGLSITGDLDVNHIATENDDHAVEIDVDAAGFGDVKGIDIVYTTNTISAGEEEGIILINIDESLAAGGDVIGIGILTTEGLASIYGLEAGVLVNPIVQLSGTFGNMDSANNSGVDNLSNFISSSDDHPIFVSDNDYVTIGDANKFEEIEFLLNTTASGAGIKPTFEFSTGADTWTTFSPTDGTNGMRNTGIIVWFDSDIPTWATGVGTEYLIRINRTANALTTFPIEDKVQISAVTIYKWDKDGNIVINEINASLLRSNDWTNVSITESQISDLQAYALAVSLPNVTMQQVNDSQGNWSQDKPSYQLDIGSDCSAGDFVKGVDNDGTLDCDTPTGGAAAGDKWVDAGDWISPNTTFASWVNASQFTADLGINVTKMGIVSPAGATINASGFYDDGVLLVPDTTIGNETTRVDLIIGTYIPNNATADRTYTDTRVDSIENFTMQDINGSIGNHSQWLGTYPNVDTDDTDDVSQSWVVGRFVNTSWTNNTYYGNILNTTINTSIDLRVTVSFLQNLLDTIYLAITNLGTLIQNSTIIRSGLNESWVNDTVSEGTIVRAIWTNVTYDAEFANATIIRTKNTSWAQDQITGGANISVSSGVVTVNMSCATFTGDAGLCDGDDAVTSYTGGANISLAGDVVSVNASGWDTDSADDLLEDGTNPLTADWDAGSYYIIALGFNATDWGNVSGLTDAQISNTLTCSIFSPTTDADIGSHKLTAETLESDVATGTAPIIVASATQVANLNVSYAQTAYNLSNTDFGDFTCAEGSCTLDADSVGDNEIDYTESTLADFINDINAITNTSDGKLGLLNITTNLTIHASNIWWNGSGICIGNC